MFSFSLCSSLRQRRYALALAIALLVTGASWWRNTRSASHSVTSEAIAPLLPTLDQDPQIQAFFNYSEASVYTDPYRQITRHGDNLEAIIIETIEQADTSVDVAVQALNLPLVAQALIDSQHRGVSVRLILENQYSQPWSRAATSKAISKINLAQLTDWRHLADANKDGQVTNLELANMDALAALEAAGVPRLDDTADGSKGSGLMHHKFLIADQRWVVMGTANFTLSGIHGDAAATGSRGNANSLLKLESSALAQQMTAEFDLMWGDGPGRQPDSRFGLGKPLRTAQKIALDQGDLTLQFSPVSAKHPWEGSVNGLIARTLSQASKQIDLALFVFSEQPLANQLEIQSDAGINLRLLVDAGFIYRSYSEALDLLGETMLDQRCQIEENNRPWTKRIDSVRSPQMPPGDKFHHKFATIDKTTVIVGSQNWSHAANTVNDEALFVIRNPTVTAHFSREFERLYRTARLDEQKHLQRKLSASKQRCS